MAEFFRLFFGLFCWLLVWCLAFWRGRWPERTAAAGTLAIGIVSFFVHIHPRDGSFDYQGALTDGALFVLFLALAIRANRIWPIPAAGFQFIAVLTHFVVLLRHAGSGWAYQSVSVLATWLVLIAFAVGLWENELRRKYEREASQSAPSQGSEP